MVGRGADDFLVGPVDLLTDRDLKIGLGDLVSAEGANDDCEALLILDRISDCLPELRGEKLALAVVAFLLELEANLLTVDLIADAAVGVRSLESALAEVELVAYLAAQLRRRIQELLLFPLQQVLAIRGIVVVGAFLLDALLAAISPTTPAYVFGPCQPLLLLLMVEEAAEDGIAGQNTAGAHRLIDTSCHLKHAVPVARIYN